MKEPIYCCNCNKQVGEFDINTGSTYAKMYFDGNHDYKGRTICPDCGCFELSDVKTNLEKRVIQ